jgi:hypothetical protein
MDFTPVALLGEGEEDALTAIAVTDIMKHTASKIPNTFLIRFGFCFSMSIYSLFAFISQFWFNLAQFQ